jgi:hypothetical protein
VAPPSSTEPSRADVIRADIDRIRGMSDAEFAEKWGDWARRQDRDLKLVRRRWLEDLEYALPHAEREAESGAVLVAAKDAYRADPSEENKAAKDAAVRAVQDIRAEERGSREPADPKGFRLAGDAYVVGG